MSEAKGLKQDLGLIQGIGLLATSLLGTGVFAVPALVAQIAQQDSLWAWPLLMLLCSLSPLGFAALGQRFPNAGGVAHFVNLAFGTRLARVSGWLFLSVIRWGCRRRCRLPLVSGRRRLAGAHQGCCWCNC